MKKLYILSFLLFIPSLVFARVSMDKVEELKTQASYIYSFTEMSQYIKDSGTCTGVEDLKTIVDFKSTLLSKLNTISDTIPPNTVLSESQLKLYNEYKQLQDKQSKQNAYQYIMNDIRASYITGVLDNIESNINQQGNCNGYKGQEEKYCKAYQSYKDGLLTTTERNRLQYLNDNAVNFNPVDIVYKSIMDNVYKDYQNKCKLLLTSKVDISKEVKSSKIESVTDKDVSDIIKNLKNKYLLMSKTQKEKIRNVLKELK